MGFSVCLGSGLFSLFSGWFPAGATLFDPC